MYAFYEPEVVIETHKGQRTHAFTCAHPTCAHVVHRYVHKHNCSTGNLCKHTTLCWGEEAVEWAMETANDVEARKVVVESLLKTGCISTYFPWKKNGGVTYSHMQHTREETW